MRKTLITFTNEDVADRNSYLREMSSSLRLIEHYLNQPQVDKKQIISDINYMHELIRKIGEQKYIVSHLEQED